ncbi:hypothetical protein [Microvirga sp. Mcv34]|uniref:hypothetical protein n=1 Tax=Microvirga sp. Mcv34 TaxID=2926016 RepID=UPI0021C56DEB|nr:hypothetical protein [Microvirga sp. Mcv34]
MGVPVTKAEPVEGENLLCSFLTSEPHAVVAPAHSNAMPVTLTTPEEYATWLTAPVEEALNIARQSGWRARRSGSGDWLSRQDDDCRAATEMQALS